MPRFSTFRHAACCVMALVLLSGLALCAQTTNKPAPKRPVRRSAPVHHRVVHHRSKRHVVERADHSRLVYERGRRSYISHPYVYHGHEFARRAYYWHGHAYNRFYIGYGWHGVHLEVYAPVRFYGVGYYRWAYHPWVHPYAYEWGWGVRPWYGYYHTYFVPYPVYAGPSQWLADYTISESLAADYEAAAATGMPPPMAADVAPLSPEVKQMVADELQHDLDLERIEAQLNEQGQPPDPAISSIAGIVGDGKPHTFVAGDEVSAVDEAGDECKVTDGDVLQLTTPPAPDATEAQVIVLASKGGAECRKSAAVYVPLEDLQEMQNHMRETMDQGLAELQAKQGTSGLPAPPEMAMAAPVDAVFAQGAPPPEPGGAEELAAEGKQPDQLDPAPPTGEQAPAPIERPSGASTAPASAPSAVNLAVGQSMGQVITAMGQPQNMVNLGTKTIFTYNGVKVTFVSGKVTDIE